MTAETISIQVSPLLYKRLERLSLLTQQPLEQLVERTLAASLPPIPEDLPIYARDALMELEVRDDEQLRTILRATLSKAQHEEWLLLRERNRDGVLMPEEQAKLTQLASEADLLTLRKAYAAALLKWRGSRVPSIAELEQS